MKKYLFYFAVAGWVLGLLVHIVSVAGVDVTEWFPYVWLLHIGIFAVWIPMILELKENEGLKAYQQLSITERMKPFGFYKIAFKDTPTWLVVIAVAGFLYAGVNFALFVFSQPGTPLEVGGIYTLQNHGQLIKILTLKEYHQYKANEVRGFSGHWLAFYGIAAAVLYPYSKTTATNNI